MQHTNIYTCNVSVVRVNGNTTWVGAPTHSPYARVPFAARARVPEPCKGHVAACFRACRFAGIRAGVQVSGMACRTIGFVLIMYQLYGLTVTRLG